jgi:hypothetical protein
MWNYILIQQGGSIPTKYHRQNNKTINTNKNMALESTVPRRQKNDCQNLWPKPTLLSTMLRNERNRHIQS